MLGYVRHGVEGGRTVRIDPAGNLLDAHPELLLRRASRRQRSAQAVAPKARERRFRCCLVGQRRRCFIEDQDHCMYAAVRRLCNLDRLAPEGSRR
jgi:hypothetical protein